MLFIHYGKRHEKRYLDFFLITLHGDTSINGDIFINYNLHYPKPDSSSIKMQGSCIMLAHASNKTFVEGIFYIH